MRTKQIIVTCDRCRQAETFAEGQGEDDLTGQIAGWYGVGDSDICGACWASFQAWWSAGSKDSPAKAEDAPWWKAGESENRS
jgi:hypothetical protein